MTMIPEHNMDFSMLELTTDGAYSYQPQVFPVLSIPETILSAETLSGKGPAFTPLASDDQKIELPTLEHSPVSEPITVQEAEIVDDEFDADPAFALFSTTPKAAPAPVELDITALLAGITVEKPCQYEVIVESEDDIATADAALKKFERMCANLESMTERLRAFTTDL